MSNEQSDRADPANPQIDASDQSEDAFGRPSGAALRTDLLADLKPNDCPRSLFGTRWVRKALLDAESDRLNGLVTESNMAQHFRNRLRTQFQAMKSDLRRVVVRACCAVNSGPHGGHDTLVEDILSELLYTIVRMPQHYDPVAFGNEEAWFSGIVRHLVQNTQRKSLQRNGHQPVLDVTVANPAVVDMAPLDTDRADLIRAMLAALHDDTDRATFTALYIDELSPEAAAERLGVSRWVVYKRREAIAAKLDAADFRPH